MFRAIQAVASALLLSACQTYWAFPPGKGLADFRADESLCRGSAAGLSHCLSAMGYRQITYDEYLALQQRGSEVYRQMLEAAKRPTDIVAYDVRSGAMYVGKATPKAATTSAIEVEGIGNDAHCSGFSEVKKIVPGARGSIGSAHLICRDGRKISGDFVYETHRSGFGAGVDQSGREYRFIFGDLDINPDALKARFKEMLEKEKLKASERPT